MAGQGIKALRACCKSKKHFLIFAKCELQKHFRLFKISIL